MMTIRLKTDRHFVKCMCMNAKCPNKILNYETKHEKSMKPEVHFVYLVFFVFFCISVRNPQSKHHPN